ncbi:hypothetical protein [Kitasatospora indigofera]|uniref:hypothetical protein n=1 Tax=Kitasatospora indigofera TaxID=67307 RepID=UPI00368C93B7
MKIGGLYGPADRAGALEFVTLRLDRRGPQEAAALSTDVHRLVASAFSDTELETLWISTTGRRFAPGGGPGGIRDFLVEIADICARFILEGDEEAFAAQAFQFDSDLIRRQILNELDTVRKSLLERCEPSFKESIVPLLERVVGDLGADLGMRLFLRALKSSFAPIGLSRLARLEAIGEQLGYSDLVVADGTLNTHFDMND